MEETLKLIQEQLAVIALSNKDVVSRLSALESADQVNDENENKRPDLGNGRGDTDPSIRIQNAGKEKSLTLTFGDDCSATSLRLFLDHYDLAKAQNEQRGIEGWDDPVFRSRELRFQLRGEPSLWIAHESAMAQDWTSDDNEVIKKLKQRYLGAQSMELNIVQFEELVQGEGETLPAYMTRCQEKGLEAFAGFDEPRSTQQRIVWKFLSGIRDPAIRSEVIRQRWMKSPTEAKSFDEVLHIAEQAKLDRLAAAATGAGTGKGNFNATPVSKVGERRKGNSQMRRRSGESSASGSSIPSTPSPSPRLSRSSQESSSSGGGSMKNGVNFMCHYCNTKSHYGGWKTCPKRRKEDPGWTPSGF